MSMNSIPVLQVLRDTMSMLGARQKVLARNIANADTPGFAAKDIDQDNFQKTLAGLTSGSARSHARRLGKLTLEITDPRHISSSSNATGRTSAPFNVVTSPDSEISMNGNSVVLEEQVSRVAQTRMRYEAAAGLYEKSMGLLRLALSRPGR